MPSVSRKGYIFAAVLAVVGIGAVVHLTGAEAVGKNKDSASPKSAAALELASVDVTTVERRDLKETLRVSGQLEPIARGLLKAKVSGTVIEVLARPGEHVKAGDLLVRLEDSDLRSVILQQESGLESAEALLLLAELGLAKSDELARRGFAAQSTLEKAQSDVATASASVRGIEAQLATARQALEDAELHAPFNGIVATRAVEPGETASVGAELLTVIDVSELEAELLVSTRDIGRLRQGQEVELKVDGTDVPVTGIVDRISPVANDGSRSVPVYVRVGNPDGRMWGGMFATGEIQVRSTAAALSVPASALRSDSEGSFLVKVSDGKAVRQPVKVEAEWKNGSLLQVSGLAAGDVVISAPIKGIEPGMAVSVSAAR